MPVERRRKNKRRRKRKETRERKEGKNTGKLETGKGI
jgi:hypothetical protein